MATQTPLLHRKSWMTKRIGVAGIGRGSADSWIKRPGIVPRMILALGGFLAGLNACAPDTRISVAELQKREKMALDVPPVPLDSAQLPLTDLTPYKIGVGDLLTISIVGVSGAFMENKLVVRVHDDGNITLPQVGKLAVGGMTLQAAERAINESYVPKFIKEELSVYVEVTSPEATTILMTGAAGNRGLLTLKSNQRNLLYALQLSGSYLAAVTGRIHVRSIRPDHPEVVYNLGDATGNGLRRILNSPPLETGDTVIVEAGEAEQVYVIGLVNGPRPLPVSADSKLSVVRAIAATGGTRDMLDPPEATVWRKLPDGEQVRVKLPLSDMLAGAAPDFDLKAGDILEVPHTASTRARDWFIQNIRVGPFSVTTTYNPLAQYNTNRALNDNNNGNSFQDAVINELQRGLPNLILPQPTLQP